MFGRSRGATVALGLGLGLLLRRRRLRGDVEAVSEVMIS